MGRYSKYIIALIVALIVASCCGNKGITNTEYIYQDKIVRDSIFDSIFIKDSSTMDVKGDTITFHHWHHEYHHDTKIRDSIVHDTLYKDKEVIVEDKKAVRKANALAVGIGVAFILLLAIILVEKLKKKP